MFQIQENTLITNEGEVTFPRKIETACEIGKIILACLVTEDAEHEENIYGVKDGRILWQVQEAREYSPALVDNLFFKHLEYAWVEKYEKDPSVALGTMSCGLRYLIDPETGKFVGEESWVR